MIQSLIIAAAIAISSYYQTEPEPAGQNPDNDPTLAVQLKAQRQELERELSRFTYPAFTTQFSKLATGHYEWVKQRKCLNTDRPWWADYQTEAHYRSECWSALWRAQQKYDDLYYRLEALQHLERLIGKEYFDLGIMPTPMPCWNY